MGEVTLHRGIEAVHLARGRRDRMPCRRSAGVSFNVDKGEIVALIGPSGCGKTTALRIIMGLETATSGQVKVAGRPVSGCGHDRGMVFQHAELLPWRNTLSNIGWAGDEGHEGA